jgi:hypothetical protein
VMLNPPGGVFDEAGFAHAVGGAIALAFRRPRALVRGLAERVRGFVR